MLLRVIRSATTYQLLDHGGRLIGTVARPASDPVVGRGAGAVLLTRTVSRHQRPTPAPVNRISSAVPALPDLRRAEPAA